MNRTPFPRIYSRCTALVLEEGIGKFSYTFILLNEKPSEVLHDCRAIKDWGLEEMKADARFSGIICFRLSRRLGEDPGEAAFAQLSREAEGRLRFYFFDPERDNPAEVRRVSNSGASGQAGMGLN